MRKLTLDCSQIGSKAGLHLQLTELLDLPAYYGNNLDALADCISEIHQETCLVLEHPEALQESLGDYADRLFRLLEHCASENPFFHVELPVTDEPAVPAMKLAEALQERADLNRSIQQLESRLSANAIVQEGESPAEDPRDLLAQLNRSIDRLEELTAAINHRNSVTLHEGESLTRMIARRDALTMRLRILREFANQASMTARRARGTEIKIVSTVNVKSLQKELDNLSRELRLLDNTIQSLNWSTNL
ncbi:MAG: DIP1984 family protein [Clostridia bacterium]|nr:DIP1984 family protein [Clostridia bacterium]